MSDLKISCPNCDQHIVVDSSYLGDQILCPNCTEKVTVTDDGSSDSPSEPVAPPKRGKGLKVAASMVLLVVAAGIAAMVFLRSDQPGQSASTDSTVPPATVDMAAGGSEPSAPAVREPIAPIDPAMGMMNAMDPNMGMSPSMGMNAAPAPDDAGTGGNWPQWRGPNRDGISPETGLLREWPREGPPLAWKASGCGKGFSTVAVAERRVVTLGDGAGGSFVHCFDEATGQRQWTSQRLGNTGGDFEGPKSTPAIAGGKVYVLGQFGDLVCLDLATGREVWRKHLMRDFGGKHSQWNYAESPLVDGERLIVSPGGSQGLMVALDRQTGKLLWQSRQWTDEVQYVSPVASDLGGRRQYLTLTQKTLAGVDAASGQLLWRAPRSGATAVIPTPVIFRDIVFVTSGYGVGCNAFQISSTGGRFAVRQLYANQDLVNHHGGVVLIGQHVYGHSDRGGWKCLDITTGEEKWKHMGVGKGAVVFADGHLYCRAEAGNGSIALIEATPEGYREKGRFDQLERSNANSWAHPVVAGGRLYLRDQDKLVVHDVRAR